VTGPGLPRRAALGLPLLATAPARAQDSWPSRPIRCIVPYPPGGASDFIARVTAERMGRILGQPVIIENRGGAGGNLGTELVARAPADGYTLGIGAIGTLGVNRFLFRRLPFDPDRDFALVSLLALVPNILVVPPSLPVTDIAGFLAHVRARPSELVFGSIGNGTSQHLAGVQFNLRAGVAMTHLPYRESAQLNTDLMEGRVQASFQSISGMADLIRSGRLRALAVTGEDRVPAFAELPTLKEAGIDVTTVGWFGLIAPAAVPEAVLARLEAVAVEATMAPDVAARIAGSGSIAKAEGRAAFARFVAAEAPRLREIVTASGATAD
jgi:tripartite-type tricarboxylate transporter receptor subunit TctC